MIGNNKLKFSENKNKKFCISCTKENSKYKCPKCKAFL